MKILHTADIHLNKTKEHRFNVLSELCSIAADCDVFVIAGDLFDSYSQISHYEAKLKKLFAPLKHVIIITGNHEYLQAPQTPIWPDLGPSVHFAATHPYSIYSFGDVAMYAFAFDKNADTAQLLANFKLKKPEALNIALMHGIAYDNKPLAGFAVDMALHEENSGFVIRDENLSNAGFNAVLLGHIHKTADWKSKDTLITYSGSPTAIRNTEEDVKTANIIEVDPVSRKIELVTHRLDSSLRAMKRYYFVYPGIEEDTYNKIISFVEDNKLFAFPSITLYGVSNKDVLTGLLERIKSKYKDLPLGIDISDKTAAADADSTNTILNAFIDHLKEADKKASEEQKKELSLVMQIGWQALTDRKFSAANLLEQYEADQS